MRCAVIGDVHGRFDDEDARLLDACGYDLVLFTGDLSGYRWTTALTVGRSMARLTTPAVAVPGNHDGATVPQLGAEVLGQRGLADRLTAGMEERVAQLAEAMGRVRLEAYARHDLGGVQLVVGRPHSFGGPSFAFRAYLDRAHGVPDLAASAARLVTLFEACDERPILVLAHNGPTGLGDHRGALFGRDFHRDEGDWGDPDLGEALAWARDHGRDVRVVAAGHMHHALSGGGRRATVGRLGDTVVVNAARVPRIDRKGGRYHVRLTLTASAVQVAEVRLQSDGAAQVTAWAS